MKRIWIAAATVALLGFGAAVVTASEGGSGGATTTATATTNETQTTTTTTEDRPPRRERERERDGDDRVQAPAHDPAGPASAVDVSGPCDEAEHAGDPRCTGIPPLAAAMTTGHGRGRRRPAMTTTAADTTTTTATTTMAATTAPARRQLGPRRRRPRLRPSTAAHPCAISTIHGMAQGRRTILMVEDESSITNR